MKSLWTAGILSFAIGSNVFAAPIISPPISAEQLRNQLEVAVKAKDTNAVLSLVNWKGVSSEMKAETSSEMADSLNQGVFRIKLLPLPSDQQLTNEMNGIRYSPNVHVLGLINLESPVKGNDSQIPYGESGGKFYIAGVVQEILNPQAKKAKSLGVMVMGLFPSQSPGILTCSYIYLNDGKEKSDSFRCTNNLSKAFWGDSIKSCTVKKISGQGSFQLMINEDGQTVFDSDMVETNNSITYEKKNL
jgi:hypothetical protein